MIFRMLLFGATGDLAGRFLLPALAALLEQGKLADDFRLVGCAPEAWDDDQFRTHAAHRLGEHAKDVAPEIRDRLLDALGYRQADIQDADRVAELVQGIGAPLAAYIALPASLFPDAIRNIGSHLPEGSRLVLEKPFGENLASARALNALIGECLGRHADEMLYRVDHALGMGTISRLIALRNDDRFFERVWGGGDVAEIDILWEETLGLEGRAGFFDQTGTMRDVMQNHMLQLLALTAMETPRNEGGLAAAKRDLLAAIPTVPADRLPQVVQKARYTAGWLADGRYVGSYKDEEGVEADRGTETFAEVLLTIENERWKGTRVRLRAGKALAERNKGVVLRFKPPEQEHTPDRLGVDELRIGIDGPRTTELRLAGTTEFGRDGEEPMLFAAAPPATELDAYGNVLADILSGGSALSVSAGEEEEAWRILDPIVRAWGADQVPTGSYEAGSDGPPRLSAIADQNHSRTPVSRLQLPESSPSSC